MNSIVRSFLLVLPFLFSAGNPCYATVNPIGFWHLDETTGSTAADASGGGRTITLSGGYTHTTGKLNNGITFDGTTGYGSANWGLLTGAADRSICLWFRTSSTADSTWVSWGSSAANSLCAIGIQGGNVGFLRNTSESSGINCVAPISTSTYANGQWHHLAVVVRANLHTIQLYIDGVLAMSRSRYPNTATSQIYFGRSVNGGTFFNGSLDEIAIYDRAVTALEVATISGLGTYPLKRVTVTSPANAYGSDVTGTTTYSIAAPGLTSATVKCWQSGGTYGSDATVASITLSGTNGTGSFSFPATSYPKGPISLRITATNGTDSDTCYLQLYNTVGASWQQGIPAAPQQAAGLSLVFSDDFTVMPDIVWSKTQIVAATDYVAYGDYSTIPFTSPTSPNTPFSQRDTYLRIRADAAAMTTGQISSVFTVQQPCYMECRFIAQSAMGTWPAFWSVTDGTTTGYTDEQDVIEAYGGEGPGTPNAARAYNVTSHEWTPTGQNPLYTTANGSHISSIIDMSTKGGQAGWSYTPHVYGMLVTATTTTYYLDNIPIGSKNTTPVSQTDKFDVKMDMAAGGGWPIDLQRYADRADMYVDYVRVYGGPGSLPGTPTGLAATGGDTQVSLSWTASSAVASYEIYRGTSSNGQGATPIASGITATSYVNTGLSNGVTYYYKVKAVNVIGTSPSSNEASATPASAAAPAAPTGLAATPGNTQVSLSWNASAGATSYNVYRGTTANGESTTPIATGIVTTGYTNTGLTNGTTYYYKVKAVNASGTSGYSNEASAVPTGGSAPAAPTGLAATPGNTQISLSWSASSGATSYEIYRGTTSNGQNATPIASGVTATNYTNTGLTNGTTYYYKVKAVNASGASGYSNEASAVPAAGGPPSFANASFETPSLTTYSYNPAGSSWTFANNAGIQHNGSAYSGSVVAPDGVQTAFVQSISSTLGTMSQSVNFPAGTYRISFQAARRSGNIQPIRVSVDGTAVGTYTPASNSFALITTAYFTVTAGSHTISFAATDNVGDKTSFIDLVSIGL